MAQNIVQSNVRLQYAENGNFSTIPLALDAGSAYTYINQFPTLKYDESLNINPGPTPTLNLPLTGLANVDTIAVWNLSFTGLLAVTWQQTIITQTQWTGVTTPTAQTANLINVGSNFNAVAGNPSTVAITSTNGTTYTFTAVAAAPTAFQFLVGAGPSATGVNLATAVNLQTSTTGVSTFAIAANGALSMTFAGATAVVATSWGGTITAGSGNLTLVTTPLSPYLSANIVGPRQCLLIPGGLLNGLNNTYGGINPAVPLTLTGLTSVAFPARIAIVGGG